MKTRFPILALVLCWLWGGGNSFAQQNANPQPPMPQDVPSPVELFRNLITTNAAAREQFLASKSPQARRIIEAKLREYEGMVAGEREAKLRVLRIRWQTLQLMQVQPAERMARLESLPASDRAIVESQLGPFIILPPGLQQEVLSNPAVMRALARGESSPEKPLQSMTEEERKEEERKQQLLSHLPEFFQLSPTVRTKALSQLAPATREPVEKTFSNISSMPRPDREEAIAGLTQFTRLSLAERAAFIQSAERWRTMSEKDRALSRRIAALMQKVQSKPPVPGADAGTRVNPTSAFGKPN